MSNPAGIFLSYASEDRPFAEQLGGRLGISDWEDAWTLRPGDNWLDEIHGQIKQSDWVLVILSRASSRSKDLQSEISAFLSLELSATRRFIVPVLAVDAEIPVALRDRPYADFRTSFDHGLAALQKIIDPSGGKLKSGGAAAERKEREEVLKHQIAQIRADYDAGNLVLVCGAGTSIAAGLPSWAELLQRLLTTLFSRKTGNGKQELMAELFQESFRPTPLIVGQYLKNGLGKDFLSRLQSALYAQAPERSDFVDAIVELCRPQRSRESLHSIITYNFDDLIEHNLKQNAIRFRPIFKEGQRSLNSELPVYHVHGYLPRDGALTEDHAVVLSEDAYHSQFIEPFSWSNIIQLNHLNQNRCLFAGLSFTDPNLRRLLDVAMRRNPDRVQHHYAIKTRYDAGKLLSGSRNRKNQRNQRESLEDLIKVAEAMEEQDANNLGLNVIWVSDHAKIPAILKSVASVQ